MTVAELERAVKKLSPQELNRFREWFNEYFADMWDKQIEADAKAGRLDKILAEAEAEYNAGLSKPL
jgi:hypothetical protein